MLALIASHHKYQFPLCLCQQLYIRPNDYVCNQTGLHFVVNLIPVFLWEITICGRGFFPFRGVNSTLWHPSIWKRRSVLESQDTILKAAKWKLVFMLPRQQHGPQLYLWSHIPVELLFVLTVHFSTTFSSAALVQALRVKATNICLMMGDAARCLFMK